MKKLIKLFRESLFILKKQSIVFTLHVKSVICISEITSMHRQQIKVVSESLASGKSST